MSQWVIKGLQTGIKTTRYPAREETQAGVSPGLPLGREQVTDEQGRFWWIIVRLVLLFSKTASCSWNPAGAYTASDVPGRSNSRSIGGPVMSGPAMLLVEALPLHHGPKSSRRRYTSWWSIRVTAARA